MTITLELNPKLQTQLEAQAQITGKQVSDLIVDAIEAIVLTRPSDTTSPKREETVEWLARFDDWAKHRKSYNPHFDDSRESIYAGRP